MMIVWSKEYCAALHCTVIAVRSAGEYLCRFGLETRTEAASLQARTAIRPQKAAGLVNHDQVQAQTPKQPTIDATIGSRLSLQRQ